VDVDKDEVLYISISHIITYSCVKCFNHTASLIGARCA